MSDINLISMLLYIGLALITARLFGEIFERIKLSAILGELLAGILFGGPLFSLFGLSMSDIQISGTPIMNITTLGKIAQIGIYFLLFIVGMDINLREMRKIGKQSLAISLTEVSIALIGGFLTAFFFLRRDFKYAIFFGTLFTATSIGVTVRTLNDIGKLGTKEGQTLLSVAVFDDFIALILVLILSSTLFITGEENIWLTLLKDIGILIVFLLFIIILLPKVLEFLEQQYNLFSSSRTSNFALGIVFGLLVLLAFFAEVLHFSGAVIAFLLGLSIQQNKTIIGEIKEGVIEFGEGVFIPLFFFYVGANFNLNLGQIGAETAFVIPWGIWLMIPMAILSKGLGAFFGSTLMGFSPKSAGRIAVGISPRAEILLVIAGVGMANGLFGTSVYTMTILLVFVTVLLTPIALQLVFREKKKDDEKENSSEHDEKEE